MFSVHFQKMLPGRGCEGGVKLWHRGWYSDRAARRCCSCLDSIFTLERYILYQEEVAQIALLCAAWQQAAKDHWSAHYGLMTHLLPLHSLTLTKNNRHSFDECRPASRISQAVIFAPVFRWDLVPQCSKEAMKKKARVHEFARESVQNWFRAKPKWSTSKNSQNKLAKFCYGEKKKRQRSHLH